MYEIIQGDCIEVMTQFEDKSFDLVLTSPPYDNLRTYEDLTWNEDIWKSVIQELFRVTEQGGVVVWVVGDATIKGSETGTSFKQALWAIKCGFNLHDTMIYEKLCYMPLTHNRQEQVFEYMFIFSKGKPKTFNPKLKKNKCRGATITGNRRHDGNKLEKIHGAGGTIKEYGYDVNIWRYATGSVCYNGDVEARKHPAVFPYKLANDHIASWSNKGDLVLDPFMGSGTTGIACANTGRDFIGIDMNEHYCEIAKARIKDATRQGKLF